MFDSIVNYFGNSNFLPHGYCLAWDPLLLWSMVGSDLAIAVSYFSIPVALLIFMRRHRNLKFTWVFGLFGLFIFACGSMHLINILNVWRPVYRLDAVLGVLTAAISTLTAITLWPLLPKASAFFAANTLAQCELQAANKSLGESLALLEQRRSQIEESERRFRLTLETAPIGCAVVALDGQWITVNPALCNMLGYTEKELLKMKYQDFTDPRFHAEDDARVKTILERGSDTYRIEKRYRVKHGREIDVQLDIALLRDDYGKPLYFVTQIQDITAQKRVEAELQASRAKLVDGFTSLSQQNHDITLLGELSAIIQACQSLDEIAEPIAHFGRKLFPDYGGVLYLRRDTGDVLEAVAQWNGAQATSDSLTLDQCWALRRGQPHGAHELNGLRCAHLREPGPPGDFICVPMSAQGESMGLLYLQALPEREQQIASDTPPQKLAAMVVERLGIALANIRLRQSLRQESIRDPLTRLFNRRYLAESLPRELSRAERERQELSVLMFDVDHFKKFNDTYGHELGDQVLRMIGDALFVQFRGNDIVCRYGGEEFAVVLARTTLPQALLKAEQLRAKVRSLEVTYRHQAIGPITISIGLASSAQHGFSAGKLLAAADKAMYAAKNAGRDCVVASTEDFAAEPMTELPSDPLPRNEARPSASPLLAIP
jgi:diguanylate cyclase (GGDEF)-like protein/PAS domain S-box-containing protein